MAGWLEWMTEREGDLDDIAALHDSPAADERPLSFVFFGKPDFWVELRRPLQVRGIFGITRTTRWLGVGADDPAALRRRLSAPDA